MGFIADIGGNPLAAAFELVRDIAMGNPDASHASKRLPSVPAERERKLIAESED